MYLCTSPSFFQIQFLYAINLQKIKQCNTLDKASLQIDCFTEHWCQLIGSPFCSFIRNPSIMKIRYLIFILGIHEHTLRMTYLYDIRTPQRKILFIFFKEHKSHMNGRCMAYKFGKRMPHNLIRIQDHNHKMSKLSIFLMCQPIHKLLVKFLKQAGAAVRITGNISNHRTFTLNMRQKTNPLEFFLLLFIHNKSQFHIIVIMPCNQIQYHILSHRMPVILFANHTYNV